MLLSFLLLYGGCALGLTQNLAGFVGWTVYLTVCGIGYALYIYYLAVTKSYEVVEGTVTEIHAELHFDGFKRVLVQGDDGLTTELLLNKETTVMHGKTYRFYFNQSDHARSGIHRLDAAFDFGNFFWRGGGKRVIQGGEHQHGSSPCRPVSIQLYGKYEKRRDFIYVGNKMWNREMVQRKKKVTDL